MIAMMKTMETKTMKSDCKFWNIKTDGNVSRIDLFGYVGGSKAWNDGFNEEDLLKELRAIPEENALEISINSFGGSMFTALSIYTLLKAHKGSITFRIDGAAMSAATIITSVPNAKVIMPKGAIMMIHKVSSKAQGDADKIRKTADAMEKLEQNILDIYAEKTGKAVEEIKPLLDAETYFTASEAVEFGLADELDESTSVTNVMGDDFVSLNGLEVEAKMFERMPKDFINKAELPKASAKQNPDIKEEKIMTLESLKAEHPELVEAIRKEVMEEAKEKGVKEERARIKAIEDIAVAGHEEMVQSAKFDNAISAEQLAVAILKADKQKMADALANRVADAQEVNEITPSVIDEGVPEGKPKAKTREEQIAEAKAEFEAAKKL
jgi:ATP-dependent protease ClpP protease subunit